jgi:hypothetical protein
MFAEVSQVQHPRRRGVRPFAEGPVLPVPSTVEGSPVEGLLTEAHLHSIGKIPRRRA